MIHILTYILLLLACTTANGQKVSQAKAVDHFDRVSIAKGINAVVMTTDEWARQQDSYKARAKADKQAAVKLNNIFLPTNKEGQTCIVRAEPTVAKAVVFEVEGDRLYVYANSFQYKQSKRIDVTIVCDTTLREIEGQMGSNISSKGTLRTKQLNLVAGDAIEMHITTVAEAVTITGSRSSIVWLTGTVGTMTATITGNSYLKMKDIKCQVANVTAQRYSRADLIAESSLNITAEESSEVTYQQTNATVTITNNNSKVTAQ